MRTTVIGGTGHIGTYLIPRLIAAGHEVTVVSRSQRKPYFSGSTWDEVRAVVIDRRAAEQEGNFVRRLRDLKPDIVIDLICFTVESARQLVEGLRGSVQQLLSCGTIWVHGPSIEVPTSELQPRHPFGDYGIKKAAVERYLLEEAERNGVPVTILHPGHIVGRGWAPLNPAGHFNPHVFSILARGEELALPNFGLETVHHVHADDVAHAFLQAVRQPERAVAESFHVVSPAALTLRGYAEAVAGWYGKEARLSFLPWREWKNTVSEEEAEATWDHIAHSPCCSISKARRLLDYQPRYSSLTAVKESVSWLVAQNVIQI